MEKNIIILGAGFGGLRAARQIHKELKKLDLLKNYKIALADKNDFHTFTPLLYEVATTSGQTAGNLKLKSLTAYPLPELLKATNVVFVNDEIAKIDLPQSVIRFKKMAIKFDYLILALGSETNYFNIPGLKENSLSLKTFEDAIKIRDAIWGAFSLRKNLPLKELKNLQIIIGGGGSTGVELAGEIKEWICELQAETDFSCGAEVAIIERAPTILSNFNERVIRKVEERLQKLAIKIVNGEIITKVIPKAVVLESGKIIPFDILIWTGGIKTPAIIQKLPLLFDEKMRIKTTETLECLPRNEKVKFAGKIFAIGDIATGGLQVARAAISQADIAAKNIIEKIKREQNPSTSYSPKSYPPAMTSSGEVGRGKLKAYPYIIPVGGKFAVAKIGPFVISGFWAWVLKGLVELNYLLSIMPNWKALKIWLKGLRVFIQNDRLG